MVVFISGPMTGLPDFNRPAFHEAAKKLQEYGHSVWNPAHAPDGLTHEAYMAVCKAMIDQSDVIVQLPGWEQSKGAQIEYEYATRTNKEIWQEVML